VHFGLGYLHWKLHQYDDAKSNFEKELSINPENPQALVYLGDTEMKRNNPEKALSLLEKAVQLKGTQRMGYLDLGTVLTTLKRYPEAIAALQHAQQLDPAQPDAHFRLGRLYQATGNTAEAQKEFSQARKLYQKAGEKDTLAPMMSGSPPPLQQ
jgi:tetratricopeptide (TPR) repeat protein